MGFWSASPSRENFSSMRPLGFELKLYLFWNFQGEVYLSNITSRFCSFCFLRVWSPTCGAIVLSTYFERPMVAIMPRPGIEPGTFRSSVWRSPNWAKSASVAYDSKIINHITIWLMTATCSCVNAFIRLASFSISNIYSFQNGASNVTTLLDEKLQE